MKKSRKPRKMVVKRAVNEFIERLLRELRITQGYTIHRKHKNFLKQDAGNAVYEALEEYKWPGDEG